MNREELVLFVGALGVQKIQAGGSQYVMFTCPLARWRHQSGEDHTPSTGAKITDSGPSWTKCFGCGFHGTFSDLVATVQHYSETDLSALLRQTLVLEADTPESIAARVKGYDRDVQEQASSVFAEDYLDKYPAVHGTPGHAYMLGRGFTDSTLQAWSVAWDADYQMVVVPVRNRSGELVGAEGRSISVHASLRYYDYWHWPKDRFVLGEHLVPPGRTLIVCEGNLSTVKLWQLLDEADCLGRYAVVGTMGSEITQYQLRRIVDLAESVISCTDFDLAGMKARSTLLHGLSRKLTFRILSDPQCETNEKHKDPDDFYRSGSWSPDNIEAILEGARISLSS